MADLPAPWLAEARRPWPKPQVTPELVHCPHCRGSLPPDTEAACQECGTGTPAWLITFPGSISEEDLAAFKQRWRESEVAGVAVLGPSATIEEVPDEAAAPLASPAPEPTGWMTMLKSWARWPNA